MFIYYWSHFVDNYTESKEGTPNFFDKPQLVKKKKKIGMFQTFNYIINKFFIAIFYLSKSTKIRCDFLNGWKSGNASLILITRLNYNDSTCMFVTTLLKHFNISIHPMIFRAMLKAAKIIPVYKKISLGIITVPIINNISKVFDIWFYSNYNYFLRESTQFVSHNIISNSQAVVVYTDFSKSFDKIDHRILLRKLWNLNFTKSFINFWYSYLKETSFYVECSCQNSMVFPATWGVPQGFVMGPLLFMIFTSDNVFEITFLWQLYIIIFNFIPKLNWRKKNKNLKECQKYRE